jgi:hypothetical protein
MSEHRAEPRPRRPRRRVAEGGRRLHSAGSAVVVSALALLIAAFLNAPGLYKSATIQPEGWKRDVALAVTGPLESVSDALLLDRPRRGLKAAIGRSDDDEIDTGVAVPAQQAGGEPAQPPSPPRRETFSPQRTLRLWIGGDSLVVVPGQSLLRAIGSSPVIEPVREIDGHIASGLERPDAFNWFERVEEVARKDKPRAAVVMFGGNDDHGFMTGLPEGTELDGFGGPRWTEEYRRRVAAIMDTLTRARAFIVWIGLPITRDPQQTARFDTINAIVQAEAAKRPGRVSYLDTYFYFAGTDGGYAEYLRDTSGTLVKMRAEDGVHFERAAGDRIAREILKRLYNRYDLTSWRRNAPQGG